MAKPAAEPPEDPEEGGNPNVRWSKEEVRQIRECRRMLHLKSDAAYIRMAVLRLNAEVKTGSLKILPPVGSETL